MVTDVDDAEDFGGPPYACSSSRYRSIFVDSDWKMVSNGRAVLLFICNGVDVGCRWGGGRGSGGAAHSREYAVDSIRDLIPTKRSFNFKNTTTLRTLWGSWRMVSL